MRIAFLLSILLALQLGYFFSLRSQTPGSESARQQTEVASRRTDDSTQQTPGPQSPTPQQATTALQRQQPGAHPQGQAQPAARETRQTAAQTTPTPQPKPPAAKVPLNKLAARSAIPAPAGKPAKPATPRKLTQAEVRQAEAQPKSVRKKAQEVVRGCKTDREKAHAIYRYLVENVKYDVYSFLNLPNDQFPPQDAEAVLARKTAVCAGYSKLYDSMAKSVGLESEYITGKCWTKPGSPIKVRDHAWNAVKWDGAWHLMDSTWGAGSTDFKTQTFVPKPRDDWFVLSPDQFAYSHLPDDPKYLYGAPQRTLKEFDALVYTAPRYFLGHYKIGDGVKGYYQAGASFALPMQHDSSMAIFTRLESKGEKLPSRSSVVEQAGKTTLKALFPGPGDYELLVFSGKPEDSTSDYVGSVFIHAASGSAGLLPDYRARFQQKGLAFQDPDKGLYNIPNEVAISLHRPSAEVEISAQVSDFEDNIMKQMAMVNYKSDTEVEILARCPKAGRYRLNIFVGDASSDRRSFAAAVQLEAQRAGDKFPIEYSNFGSERADLQVGRVGKLPLGKPATIALRVPGRQQLYFDEGDGEFREIPYSGGVFTGTVTPRSDHLDIRVRNGDSYSALLRYQVR